MRRRAKKRKQYNKLLEREAHAMSSHNILLGPNNQQRLHEKNRRKKQPLNDYHKNTPCGPQTTRYGRKIITPDKEKIRHREYSYCIPQKANWEEIIVFQQLQQPSLLIINNDDNDNNNYNGPKGMKATVVRALLPRRCQVSELNVHSVLNDYSII